eukprot:jgi/Chlat1/7242/Chrsp58S06891
MDPDSVAELVRRLVRRLLGWPGGSQPSPRSSLADYGDDEHADAVVDKAYRYAMRIIGSRIAPSVSGDENGVADAIKRRLAQQQNRTADALTFAELHRRLAQQPGLREKWALLHLLNALADDRTREPSGSAAATFSSMLASAATGALPSIPTAVNGSSHYRNTDAISANHKARIASNGDAALTVISNDPKVAAHRKYAECERTDSQVPESALVRDVLYACQGIDGKYIRFDNNADGYIVDPKVGVARPTRELLRRICELGWLYKRVRAHIVSSVETGPVEAVGAVGQSFCSALQGELAEFYRLMAVLEAQAQVKAPVVGLPVSDANGHVDGQGGGGHYLSLRRLVVWLTDGSLRMRIMAVLVDSTRGKMGGALASAIHAHAQHGDPVVHSFVTQLLRQVCAPLFDMVRSWVFEGELIDPYGEFFVVADPSVSETDLWRHRYHVEAPMLPAFIPESLAHRILRIGKSINFLRRCCQDEGWAGSGVASSSSSRDDIISSASTSGLIYGQTTALETVVDEAAAHTDRRLLEMLFGKFRLQHHCLAIKRYLLLGQGDFIQNLMDLVGPDLNEPAHSISAFKLASTLEAAIRASNAQYDDSDVLNRLRVKLMDHGSGDVGWDVFSLEYVVDSPLSTVFTQEVMNKYLRAFNFLWRLKRVEHVLNASWQTMKPNSLHHGEFGPAVSKKQQQGGGTTLALELRRCHTLRNEMNHLISNLQYYIMWEVLECSWADFLREMEAAKDLDALITAHDKYLQTILEKALLVESSHGMYKQLAKLFDLILRFKGLADRIYETVRDTSARRDLMLRIAEQPAALAGKWGRSTADTHASSNVGVPEDFVRMVHSQLDAVASEYVSLLEGFLSRLATQSSVDLKFLAFRLDFSEYYCIAPAVTAITPGTSIFAVPKSSREQHAGQG